MLRDTLVFGLTSNKVRKDAIEKGNTLTFKQVYEMAKTEESTRAQMEAITQGKQNAELHSVRSRPSTRQDPHPSSSKTTKVTKFKFKHDGCFRCGNKHEQSAACPATHAKCKYCRKLGHFEKVCMKKRSKQVNEIVQSTDYQGQDIFLRINDSESEDSSSEHSYDDDTSSDTEPITVVLGSITSEHSVHSMSSYPDKIYTTVKINDQSNVKMKVDTGADTCVLTTDDLQNLGLSLDILPCSSVLKGYGGSPINNRGTTNLKVTSKNKSIWTKFCTVEASGHPSMIGCQQAQ